MLHTEILSALEQAENSVVRTGQALLAGHPEEVHAATQGLHGSAQALALALAGVGGGGTLPQGVLVRLARVARDIAMQREALMRRSAAVDRSVQSLLPQDQPSSYAGALGRYAHRPLAGSAFTRF